EELPWNVQICAGPEAFVCWSAKPIHIGDWCWTKLANGRPLCCAVAFGSPIWTNMCRLEVKVRKPFQAGDGMLWPPIALLPANQVITWLMICGLSLRRMIIRSLDSMETGTL